MVKAVMRQRRPCPPSGSHPLKRGREGSWSSKSEGDIRARPGEGGAKGHIARGGGCLGPRTGSYPKAMGSQEDI